MEASRAGLQHRSFIHKIEVIDRIRREVDGGCRSGHASIFHEKVLLIILTFEVKKNRRPAFNQIVTEE